VKRCGPNLSRSVHRLCVGGLLWCLALASGAAIAEEAVVSESQIKAAFLYNFPKFVEWPNGSLADKSEPITIGVVGDAELAVDLEAIVAGRKVNGRAIVVRDVEPADEVAALQMLFVSAAEEESLGALAESAAQVAILTVGESPAFASAGGIITFVQQNGKLRFEINMTSAERAQLRVSAELQKLAVSIKRSP
jgi:hypothetical protein